MTSPGVGAARVEITGDVSKFARQVQDDLNRALRGIQLEGLDRQLDEIGRSARENADDFERAFETSGEETERALKEVGDQGERQFDRIEREAKDAGSGMRRALTGAAVGIGAAFAAVQIGQFLRNSVLAADELSDAIAISEQIIQQTGGAAGLLADEIREISQNLSLSIGVDSAQVQNAANVLLTFRNVSEDTFGTALSLAADLSTVLGTDMQSATLQLGKALNDPVRGISALARAGVQFTESQKEQIKALVESGDLLGAQQIILEELESQVGGTATAAADSWAVVTNAFRETQRELGEALIPALDAMAPALIGVAESLGPVLGQIGTTLADALAAVAPALAILGEALGEALAEIDLGPVGEALGAMAQAIAPLLPVLGRLVGTLLTPLAQIVERLAVPIQVLAVALADALLQALTMIEPHLPIIVNLFGQIAHAFADNLRVILPVIIQLFLDLLTAILPLVPDLVELAESLLPIFTNTDLIIPLLEALSAVLIFAVIPAVEQTAALLNGDFLNAFRFITGPIELLAGIVEDRFNDISDFVEDSVGRVKSILRTISQVVDQVRGYFDNMRAAAFDKLNALVGFVRGIPGRITGALGNLGSLLSNAGRQVIQGFIDGIRNAFDRVRDTLSDLTSLLPDWKGPAERDQEILRDAGRRVIQGFQGGIDDQRDSLRRQLQGITAEIAPAAISGQVAGGDGVDLAAAAGPIIIENHIEIGGEVVRVIRTEIQLDKRNNQRRVNAGAGSLR